MGRKYIDRRTGNLGWKWWMVGCGMVM